MLFLLFFKTLILLIFLLCTFSCGGTWNNKLEIKSSNGHSTFDYIKTVEKSSNRILIKPNSYQEDRILSSYFFDKQKYDQAIIYYTKLIKKNPKVYEYYYNRGSAYCNRGLTDSNDFNKSIDDFSKSIEIEPLQPLNYISRGLSYNKVNDATNALVDLSKGISLYERYLNSNKEISFVDKIADDILSNYLNININDYAYAYFFRGVILYNLNNYSNAIDDFNKAIEIKSDFSDAYVYRGMVYVSTNKNDLAKQDIEKALQINPEHKIAKILITKF